MKKSLLNHNITNSSPVSRRSILLWLSLLIVQVTINELYWITLPSSIGRECDSGPLPDVLELRRKGYSIVPKREGKEPLSDPAS